MLVSGTDVAAARERAAGNIVRYAASGQNDEDLIAEARAHGIPRVVVAENGSVRELRVSAAAGEPPARRKLRAQLGGPLMLTIAVPKGALYDDADRAPARRRDRRPRRRRAQAHARDERRDAAVFLRPTDVPAYVEFGAADCGITGKDVLWETDRSVSELADLGFGYCRLCVAARRVDRYHEGAPFPTFLRVATKFQRSAESVFRRP